MPYRRIPLARTPLLAWDQLELQHAQAAWSPAYQVDGPRLVLPLEGVVHCELEGRRFVLDAGSALWLVPGQPYRLRQVRAGQRSMVLAPARPAAPAARRCTVALLQRVRLLQLAARAEAAGAAGTLAVEEGAAALVDEWLVESRDTPARPHAAVERAREWLASDPSRNDDLSTIAREAACSPFHLARLFRRHTGRSLHAWRDELRLALALQRLRRGERSLAALAVELGYSHHSHFSAAFKRKFGCSPAQMRRNLTAS